MDPLLSLDGITQRPRSVNTHICLLWFILALQTASIIMLIVVACNVARVVPDVVRTMRLLDTVLDNVNIMIPEMNATLWDLNRILPGIKRTIYFTQDICAHTKGCSVY